MWKVKAYSKAQIPEIIPVDPWEKPYICDGLYHELQSAVILVCSLNTWLLDDLGKGSEMLISLERGYVHHVGLVDTGSCRLAVATRKCEHEGDAYSGSTKPMETDACSC